MDSTGTSGDLLLLLMRLLSLRTSISITPQLPLSSPVFPTSAMQFLASALFFAVSGGTVAAAADCSTVAFASCGSDSEVICCPEGYYCQPWDSSFYQCLLPPSQCSEQLTNINLSGNDLETIYSIQPSECCTRCAETAGCVAYTFVNSNPGEPACYLKSGMGTPEASVGAVSGVVTTGSGSSSNSWTPAPTTAVTSTPSTTTAMPASTPEATTTAPSFNCSTALNGNCGSSAGTTCCPNDSYCMPWSADFYQCVASPEQCSTQETDTEYTGETIKNVTVTLPSLCCDECANTDGCKAYTYINSNPGQPACILKSAVGSSSTLVGAVSGQLN